MIVEYEANHLSYFDVAYSDVSGKEVFTTASDT
jgi:hypothetical protein